MFTGIIEATARVVQKENSSLILERPKIFDDLKVGCSIAVNGACLSVTKFDDTSMSFDVVPTTFQKTKLGALKKGDAVNLERALKADGRLEGHIVLGHCEGVGSVEKIENNTMTISVPEHVLKYVVHHGSITLDGVALTVAELKKDHVTVALIPHTLENTTLGLLKPKDYINIESDVLGKYILQAHGR
jgi:riboflavin synthase